MSVVSTDDPQLQAAVQSSVRALRRIAGYTLPTALDRYMRGLGERKEYLSEAEHEQLMTLVAFTQQRALDKLQAELALHQLEAFFPRETGV